MEFFIFNFFSLYREEGIVPLNGNFKYKIFYHQNYGLNHGFIYLYI